MLKSFLNRHLASKKLDALLERVKSRNLLNYEETLDYTVELETKLKAAKSQLNKVLELLEYIGETDNLDYRAAKKFSSEITF